MQISPIQSVSNNRPLSDRKAIEKQVQQLGEWFHNIDLFGVSTAPNHFLGDFPSVKWRHIASALPQDLSGAEVLDIGCNGGFYSIEMKRRGARRVLGIDVDERYLNQARFATRTLGIEVEFEKRSVYEVAAIDGQFDYVLFMGVFYHLRYPIYALDQVVKKIRPEGRLVFQSMLRGASDVRQWADNYHFWETEQFRHPAYPCMYFVENSYANDQTNWWVPNRAAAEAVLRSSGLEIVDHPEAETWICRPHNVVRDGEYILDLELSGRL
jgi:tRNA (mo5U34)-methyltransferase